MYIIQAQRATPPTVDMTKGWKIFLGDNPAFAQPTFAAGKLHPMYWVFLFIKWKLQKLLSSSLLIK